MTESSEDKKGKKKSEKQISTTLSIRVTDADKPLGKMITYLETLPGTKKSQHQFAMEAWFMPFALDTDSEEDQRIALQSINRLEAQARAARELWGLAPEPLPSSMATISPHSQSSSVSNKAPEEDDMGDKGDEVETEQPLRNPYKEEAASML